MTGKTTTHIELRNEYSVSTCRFQFLINEGAIIAAAPHRQQRPERYNGKSELIYRPHTMPKAKLQASAANGVVDILVSRRDMARSKAEFYNYGVE